MVHPRALVAGALLVLSAGVACSAPAASPTPMPPPADVPPPSVGGPPPRGPETVEVTPLPTVTEPGDGQGLSIFRELNPDGPKRLDGSQWRQLLGRDNIFPIYDPDVAPASDVDLDGGEMVIGVSIGGESRAYPIRTLRWREMVNDELGGAPILVTW